MDTEKKPPVAFTDDKIDDETESRIFTHVSAKDDNISLVHASVNPKEPESSPQDPQDPEDMKLESQPMKSPIDTCQSDKLDTTAHSASEDRPKTPPTRQYALEVLGEKTMQELEGTKKIATSTCVEADLSVIPPSEIDGTASEPKAIVQDSNQASEKTVAKSSSPPIEEHHNTIESESKPTDEEKNPTGTGSSKKEGEAKICEEEGTNSAENESKPSAASQGCIDPGVKASDSNVEKTSSIHSELELINEKNEEEVCTHPEQHNNTIESESKPIDEENNPTGTGSNKTDEEKATFPQGVAKICEEEGTNSAENESKPPAASQGCIEPGVEASDSNVEKTSLIHSEGKPSNEKNAEALPEEVCTHPEQASITTGKEDAGEEAEASGTDKLSELTSTKLTEAKQSDEVNISVKSMKKEHRERLSKAIANMKKRLHYWKEGKLTDERLKDGWSQFLCKRDNGSIDKYWLTPTGLSLRSLSEIERFLKALPEVDGDEDRARKVAVGKKSKTQPQIKEKTPAKVKAINKKEKTPAKRKAKGPEMPRASPKKVQKKETTSSKKEAKESEMSSTSAQKDSIQKMEKPVKAAKRKGDPKKVSLTVSTDAVGGFDFSMTNAVQKASLPKKKKHKVTKKKQMTKHISDAKGVHVAKSAAQEKGKLQKFSHKTTPTSARAIVTQGSTPVTAEPKPDLVRRKKLSCKKQAATRATPIVAENKLGVPAVAERK